MALTEFGKLVVNVEIDILSNGDVRKVARTALGSIKVIVIHIPILK